MHIYKLSPIFSAAVLLSAGVASAETKFFYNQVGYDVGQPISVIVKSDNLSDGAEFSVMSGGTAVKTGKLSAGSNPDNWLNNGKFYVADLTGLTAGKYMLQVSENGQPQNSGEFTVGENALAANTLASVLNYFYDDRADDPTVEGWDKSMGIYNSGKKVDVHGGWYDASGDVSKYLSHLSYANYLNPQQIPLTVWSLAFASERIPKLLGSTATKAKTADEAAYGADFLVRMLSEEGFFYMTVFDNWGSPLGKREICAFSGSDGIKSADYQTAFREGGGMAIAALASAARLNLKGDLRANSIWRRLKRLTSICPKSRESAAIALTAMTTRKISSTITRRFWRRRNFTRRQKNRSIWMMLMTVPNIYLLVSV